MKFNNLHEVYEYCNEKSMDQLVDSEFDYIESFLMSIQSIESIEAAKEFLSVLSMIRQKEVKYFSKLGSNALETIVGAFSGSNEGVYSANNDVINTRFIFELVQNVDDCRYESADDCHLTIIFDTVEDKVILEYNELGFQPENVIAITGLGNSTKNHKKAKNRKSEEAIDQSDLQEIGEKGIGFKSIFGLAKFVSIKSNYFSFGITRDNFFVPVISDYENFEFFKGTRIELCLDEGLVDQLYRFLCNKYKHVSAIINENPILFLNKLTEIRYYKSKNDYFGFKVSRDSLDGEFTVQDTTIEYYSSDAFGGSKCIEAIRYTKNIEYSVHECRSRYGQQEETTRKHKIIVIAPINPDTIQKGRIYSFFATEEIVNAPFIIHAPFRLNSGRTRIDSQSKGLYNTNLWFNRTSNELDKMMHIVYEDLTKRNPKEIPKYIPSDNLFDSGCAIASSIFLTKTNILKWKIFQGIDKKFYSAKEVCMLDYQGTLEDLKEIHTLLDREKVLLNITAEDFPKYQKYGIEIVDHIQWYLLCAAFFKKEKTKRCYRFLIGYTPEFEFKYITDQINSLNMDQILVIGKLKEISEWMNKAIVTNLAGNYTLRVLNGKYERSNLADKSVLQKYCEEYSDVINPTFITYINKSSYVRCDIEYPLILSNAIYGKNVMEDYASFYRLLQPKDKFFYPFLKMEAISEEIDILCQQNETIDDYEFLKNLHTFRLNQKNSLGNQYQSILSLIEKAGTNAERFFAEILQNIDDCTYNPDKPAHASIYTAEGKSKLIAEYNEIGFTRMQVRAITAIGDSTKKQLLDNTATGEKGIGFKSVFSVCSKVTIESGNFRFDLTDDKPTVPINIQKREKPYPGTRMVFDLKASIQGIVQSILNDNEKIIQNCLCLKQIHSLSINHKSIEIKDSLKSRKFIVENHIFEFLRYQHSFQTDDYSAFKARSESKEVSPTQHITYLVPIGNYQKCFVYSTFPTQEKILIPITVNMSLELDTARERICDSAWNKMLMREMNKGLINLYESIKTYLKARLPLYFPDKTGKIIDVPFGEATAVCSVLRLHPFFKVFRKEKYISLQDGRFGAPIEYYIIENHENLLGNFGSSYRETLLEKNDDAYEFLKENYFVKDTLDSITCNIINEVFSKCTDIKSTFLYKQEFRSLLYTFLQNAEKKPSLRERIITWKIIPVKQKNNTIYVSYSENIYAPLENIKEQIESEQYAILDTRIMSKKTFNDIYSSITGSYRPIRDFSRTVIIADFYNKIIATLNILNELARSQRILELFQKENELFRETLSKYKDIPISKIIFKTKANTLIHRGQCYVQKTNESQGVFNQIIVSEEYRELALAVDIPDFSDLNSIDNLPFIIGPSELKEILKNKQLNKKQELYDSMYDSSRIHADLKDGEGFFKLYRLVSNSVKKSKGQTERTIHVDSSLVSKYAEIINEISLIDVPIKFTLDEDFEDFYKDNILNEIEDELQGRKETPKILEVRELLKNCKYTKLYKKRIIVFREKSGIKYLLIDTSVTADYDIIETLKNFFLQYYNIELIINRTIHRYTRRGFENISCIRSTSEQVQKAYHQIQYVNIDNVEDVKDFLCKPLIIDGVTYGGYAKTCPLCNARIHTELTGFRIYKTKYQGILIPLISCINCHDALRYSSNIEFDLAKLREGLLDMSCIINDYDWEVKDSVIRLGHRALIQKLNETNETY